MPKLVVAIGMQVEVELLTTVGETERIVFDIVSDESADYQNGFIGAGTPLGSALIGHSAGETISYQTGDIVQARLLSVTQSSRQPLEGVKERRAATIRKAVEDSDRTNAILFASSFSGKWGDYDPGGLEHWEEHDQSTSEDEAE